MDVYSYGVRNDNPDGRGWLGRFADAFCANPVEPLGVVCVGLGRRPDFESSVTAPLILNSVSTFKVDADTEFSADHDLRVRTVKDTLATDPLPPLDPALTIFSTNQQAYGLVERVQTETAGWVNPGTYPNTTLGIFLRSISQLLYAHDSFQTRVFYTGMGGFDTHTDQHSATGTNRHAALMQQMNNGIQAFAQDMKAKGKWNNCTIVVISEFGRRN
jgi:uncharacterized protein (DUF1501 family)